MYNSDINRFNRYTNNSNLAREALFAAKEQLIYSTIDICPEPWSKEFEATLHHYYNGNVPHNVSHEFSYLFHKYKINKSDYFYLIANKILNDSKGDIDSVLISIRNAAKDFRDTLT